MSKLKSCPFCGQEWHYEEYPDDISGHCSNKHCFLYGHKFLFIDPQKFNHRPIEDALLARAEKAEEEVEQWENVAAMMADELNDANSERFPLSWEDASESSPAWIAYVNLRDRRQE